MELSTSIGVMGEYHVLLLDASSGHIVDSRSVNNLITNAGMERLIQTDLNTFYGEPKVGSGSTPPAYTDTALAQPISHSGPYWDSVYGMTSPYSPKQAVRWARFGTSQANGTIRELGVKENSGSRIVSRVVLDTPIEKTSANVMMFGHSLYFINPGLSTASITDNRGTTYTVKWCLSDVGIYHWITGNWHHSYMFTDSEWGSDNTTDPSKTDTGVLSYAGSLLLDTADFGFEVSADPSAGYWRRTTITIPATKAVGNIRELYWKGYAGMTRRSMSTRITFNRGDGFGLVKTASEKLTIVMKHELTRV